MRRKSGEEPIYARKSRNDFLQTSPADYDTSPIFGTSSPHYTIKEKRQTKQIIDNKNYPDHLEPNDMPRAPAYTIRPKYQEQTSIGVGYKYIPSQFGSSGLKKTIGERYTSNFQTFNTSPDKYNTREKFGCGTPSHLIGERLDNDKYNGNHSWIGLQGTESPGPQYDSSIQPKTYFVRSPCYTISERYNPRKSQFRRKNDYYDPPKDMEMGGGSPRTKIRTRDEDACAWMTKGKKHIPSPSDYNIGDSNYSSKHIQIHSRFKESGSKQPSMEYLKLPELSRGRQYTIGNRETMDLVY